MRRRQQQQQQQPQKDKFTSRKGIKSTASRIDPESLSAQSTSNSIPREIMTKRSTQPMAVESSYDIEKGSDDSKPFSFIPRSYTKRRNLAIAGCLFLVLFVMHSKGKTMLLRTEQLSGKSKNLFSVGLNLGVSNHPCYIVAIFAFPPIRKNPFLHKFVHRRALFGSFAGISLCAMISF